MRVRIDRLDGCFMVSIDGRDERQFDFTRSPRSVAAAQSEAKKFASETEVALATLDRMKESNTAEGRMPAPAGQAGRS